MSELSRLAQPLIDRPLVMPPSVDQLVRRNRRRHARRLVGGGTSLVIVVALALGLVLLPASPSPAPGGAPMTVTAYIRQGASVSDSALESVGLPSSVTLLPSALAGQSPLGSGPKVHVAYVGAEFCPYCAIQRWALLVALSRFGTFSHLGQVVASSSTDVYPGLQSWSFVGSSYSSSTVVFDPAEIYSSTRTGTGSYEPLQSLDPLQSAAFRRYDTGQALPFIDIGNRVVVVGAQASPSVLEDLSLDQIAADLSNPSSPVAQAVGGAANYLISGLCSLTGRSSPSICSAPFVAEAQARTASTPFQPQR